MTADTIRDEPVAADPLRGDGVREALEATTYQLERVLNMMGLYHDDAAEKVLYRAKDALAALSPAPAVGEMADLVKRANALVADGMAPMTWKWSDVTGLVAQLAAAIERLASQGGERLTVGAIADAMRKRLRVDDRASINGGQIEPDSVLLAAVEVMGVVVRSAPTSPLASPALGVGAEPIGCPTPGACSCPTALTPNRRASIICDFMGWPEDGPAWKDAHKLAALLVSPAPGSLDVERDAARWRALTRCGKIKMQGSSGVDPHTGERNGNNVHFGAEFWPEPSHYPDLAEKERAGRAWGVACLTALADAIMEREAAAYEHKDLAPEAGVEADLCGDCPPPGYPTDKTRCAPCPRRSEAGVEGGKP